MGPSRYFFENYRNLINEDDVGSYWIDNDYYIFRRLQTDPICY